MPCRRTGSWQPRRAGIAPSPDAIAVIADILDNDRTMPARLMAVNALTFVGGQARGAMSSIKRATASAQGNMSYVTRAARYLEAILEQRYDPAMVLSDGPVSGRGL